MHVPARPASPLRMLPMRLPLVALCFCLTAAWATADDHFEKHVRPLLVAKCIECHGPKKASGGLRLDSREVILKGGDTGPAAIAEKPDASLMIQAVEHRGELRMPPK